MANLYLEYARAARTARAGIDEEEHRAEIEQARTDSNFFREFVFTDAATGTPLVQGEHHRAWVRLTNEHRRLVMWFPIEHGKTTQAKMSLCELLGKHPDRQYAYVSSKDKQAKKVLAAVKREIESNDRLRMVYPDLRPQISFVTKAREQWGNTAIRVQGCPPGAGDPSLSAYGLDGQILGSRLHGVILDNILDNRNTGSRAMREWVLSVIEDEIIGRVMRGGFIWVLDTAWFEDDALHELAKKPGWTAEKFDAEVPMRDCDKTLWPAQWPVDRLKAKQGELGPTAYDRQFRNIALGESMNYFKQEAWDASVGRVPWCEEWPGDLFFDPQVQVVTGVDLATRKGESHDSTVFTTVVASGIRRRVLNMVADRMQIGEILGMMVRIYRAFHKPVNEAGGNAWFAVEDNAAQVYVVDLMRDAGHLRASGLTATEAGDIRVDGLTTTAKRRDLELGIPGLAAGIEMGRWDFPLHREMDNLRDEMKVWTPEANHYGDRLMSLWIASRALQLEGGSWGVMLAE